MMSSPYLDQYEGELHVAASYNHQQGQTNNAQRQESASRREHSSAARTATSTFNAATSQSQDHILQWFNATLAAPSSSVADLPQADAFSSLNTPTTEKQAFSSSQSSQLRQMQPFQQQQQQQQQLHPSPQLPIPVPMWPLFDYPTQFDPQFASEPTPATSVASASAIFADQQAQILRVQNFHRLLFIVQQLRTVAMDNPPASTDTIFKLYQDCYTKLTESIWLPALTQVLVNTPPPVIPATPLMANTIPAAATTGAPAAGTTATAAGTSENLAQPPPDPQPQQNLMLDDNVIQRVMCDIKAQAPTEGELIAPQIHPGWLAEDRKDLLQRIQALRILYLSERQKLRDIIHDTHNKQSAVVSFPLSLAHDPALELQMSRIVAERYLKELSKLQAEVVNGLSRMTLLGMGGGQRPMKRFPPEVTQFLDQSFLQEPYPDEASRNAIAAQLDITTKQVHHWFTNKRMRTKQMQQKSNGENDSEEY